MSRVPAPTRGRRIVAESGVLYEPVNLVTVETVHRGQLHQLAAGDLFAAIGFENEPEEAVVKPVACLFVIGFRQYQLFGELLAPPGVVQTLRLVGQLAPAFCTCSSPMAGSGRTAPSCRCRCTMSQHSPRPSDGRCCVCSCGGNPWMSKRPTAKAGQMEPHPGDGPPAV